MKIIISLSTVKSWNDVLVGVHYQNYSLPAFPPSQTSLSVHLILECGERQTMHPTFFFSFHKSNK